MRCEQFERRLHELLDERPSTSLEGSLDESLRSHVDGCSGCRDLLFEYEALLSTVTNFQSPAPSRRLASRVVEQWQLIPSIELVPATRPRRLKAWQLVAGSLTCAAALFVALLPLFQPAGPTTNIANSAKPGTARLGTGDQAQRLARAELRSEQLGSIAHQTGRGLAALVMEFPDYDAKNGQPGSGPSWLDPVADTLRPFSTVGRPFNVLLRATGGRSGQSHSS